MLVLLPPSEGKTRPAEGTPLELSELAFDAELRAGREKLLDVLEVLGTRRLPTALKALGLPPSQAGDVAMDAALRGAPAAPAASVYSGVLFERLGLPSLPPAAWEGVLIFSALWGVVRPGDRIPAYRLSMGARLPRLPGLASWWKPALARALPDDGLVLDLRSAPYAAAWRPRSATVLAVRAFTQRPDGSRAVISHMAKRVRGDVARAVLTAGREVRTTGEVLDVVRAAGMRAELGPGVLDVVE
jgi:cytoplasmic iron level regulating protein YaaA (DUF328/UPF0246 family)